MESKTEEATIILKECKSKIEEFEQYEKTIEGSSELKFYQNMKKSMKIKVQEAARRLRSEQHRLLSVLTQIETSGSNVDYFDEEQQKSNYFGLGNATGGSASDMNFKMIEDDQ